MDGRQFDEAEKLRREALIQVGKGLREHYGDVSKEVMLTGLADLLRRVAAPCEASREQRSKG